MSETPDNERGRRPDLGVTVTTGLVADFPRQFDVRRRRGKPLARGSDFDATVGVARSFNFPFGVFVHRSFANRFSLTVLL